MPPPERAPDMYRPDVRQGETLVGSGRRSVEVVSRVPGAAAAASRTAWVDNLRVALTALVVAHHAVQPYAFHGLWWVVDHAPPVPALGLFLWINASFFMGLFFLLAGAFTPSSIARKGTRAFLRDRAIRLGIPLLFGLFVMIPLLGYYAHLHNRSMGWISFPEYARHYFFGIGPRPTDWPDARFPDVQFGHLWFLQHLLLYAVVYAVWRSFRPVAAKSPGAPPGDATIALYAVALGLVTWIVRLRYPQDTWVALLGFIQTEPAHLPQYVSLFAIGVMAGRRGWLASLPAATGWRCLRVGVGLALLQCVRAAWTGTIHLNSLDTCLWEAFQCVGLCIGLLVAVLVAIQHALLPAQLGAGTKAAVAVLAGIVCSFALVHLVVRRLPGATRVL